MEVEEIIKPRVESNGKTINIISEMCSNWLIDIKVERIKSLLMRRLSYKGYTINFKVKRTHYGKNEYYIYLDEINPKKAVFTNSKDMQEISQCIFGKAIDDNNADKVVELIESKIKR